jgi:hypothetical protein
MMSWLDPSRKKQDTEAAMTKKRKTRPSETYDSFYCTIDGWRGEGFRPPQGRAFLRFPLGAWTD